MAGINQWTLVGNVGRDAAITWDEGGTTTISFSLAVERPGTAVDPLWVSVLAAGRLAEILARDGLVKKGVLALVVGRAELPLADRKKLFQEPDEREQDPVHGRTPGLLCLAGQVWVLTPPVGEAEALRSNGPMQAEHYGNWYVSRLAPRQPQPTVRVQAGTLRQPSSAGIGKR